MLMLSRRSGESIRVGENIVLVVKEVRGGQVRIGIDAPAGVLIYREEVYNRIHQQNVMAAQARMDALDKLPMGAGTRLDVQSGRASPPPGRHGLANLGRQRMNGGTANPTRLEESL